MWFLELTPVRPEAPYCTGAGLNSDQAWSRPGIAELHRSRSEPTTLGWNRPERANFTRAGLNQ